MEMRETTIGRARAGDEQAFRELTDPYRRELQLHCYRILGSLQDAEDLLQETLLAAWRGLDSSKDARRCARGCTGSPPPAASTPCATASAARPRRGATCRRRRA